MFEWLSITLNDREAFINTVMPIVLILMVLIWGVALYREVK